MVIDSMFVYHFVDPDLRVETFHGNFKKMSAFFGGFWWQKIAFKSSLELYFHPSEVATTCVL